MGEVSKEPWQNVTLEVLGPVSGTRLIVVIFDPASGWSVAKSFDAHNDPLPETVSSFLFHTFAEYGAANCTVQRSIFLTVESFDDLVKRFRTKMSMIDAATSINVRFNDADSSSGFCRRLMAAFSANTSWDESLLDAWLFKHRTRTMKRVTPFSVLFGGRSPVTTTPKTKKRRRTTRLVDKGRIEKVSCLAATRQTDQEEEKLQQQPTTEVSKSDMEEISSNVKFLLSATRRERSKRGSYAKFDARLRREMVEYANDRGNSEAAKFYTEKLGRKVAESSIRNFARAAAAGAIDSGDEKRCEPPEKRKVFEARLKDAMGRYAHVCGNAEAINHFSNKLQFPVKESTLRRFKLKWLQGADASSAATEMPISLTVSDTSRAAGMNLTFPEKNKASPQVQRKVTKKPPVVKTSGGGRRYASYGSIVRSEIGRFAVDHSDKETVSHFREKYGFRVPESTVRNLRKRGSGGDVQRGRKTILGEHEGTVKACVQQIVDSGEKLTPFAVLVTAKQVLMKQDPSLLDEHGGKIKLNPTWARSFLRRNNFKIS